MGCCGSGNLPGNSPNRPVILGQLDPDAPVVYARVMESGQDLLQGISAGDQRYFSGTGIEAALEQGMLMDVSAAAVRSKKQAARHEFLVVAPGHEPERFGVWRAAKARARQIGGRIEVVPIEEGD